MLVKRQRGRKPPHPASQSLTNNLCFTALLLLGWHQRLLPAIAMRTALLPSCSCCQLDKASSTCGC